MWLEGMCYIDAYDWRVMRAVYVDNGDGTSSQGWEDAGDDFNMDYPDAPHLASGGSKPVTGRHIKSDKIWMIYLIEGEDQVLTPVTIYLNDNNDDFEITPLRIADLTESEEDTKSAEEIPVLNTYSNGSNWTDFTKKDEASLLLSDTTATYMSWNAASQIIYPFLDSNCKKVQCVLNHTLNFGNYGSSAMFMRKRLVTFVKDGSNIASYDNIAYFENTLYAVDFVFTNVSGTIYSSAQVRFRRLTNKFADLPTDPISVTAITIGGASTGFDKANIQTFIIKRSGYNDSRCFDPLEDACFAGTTDLCDLTVDFTF